MYDIHFFRTRLGQAAMASIAAMTAMVVLSSQIAMTAPAPLLATVQGVAVA